MRRRARRIDGVWLGLLVSGAVHLAAAGVLMGVGRPDGGLDELTGAETPPPPPEEESPRTRLGIEESDHVTVTWIGFADPTPHRALPSELEQAALSMAPVGVPTPNPSPVEAEAPSPTEAAAASGPVETQRTSEASETAETTDPVEPAEPRAAEIAEGESRPATPETLEAAPEVEAPGLVGPEAERPDPAATEQNERPEVTAAPAEVSKDPFVARPETSENPNPETPTEPESAEPAVEPTAEPVPEVGGGPSGADDLPGERSDRESTPTAKLPAVTIDDWGRPAAGEGIEITPRRPRWGPTLATIARPRSPTVIIEFQRDGTVRKATFAKDGDKVLSTGNAEADRVLLNSVYNWTAKGEKIRSLAEQGPGSVYTIRMYIKIRL